MSGSHRRTPAGHRRNKQGMEARTEAIRRLIATHSEEFRQMESEERAKYGLAPVVPRRPIPKEGDC